MSSLAPPPSPCTSPCERSCPHLHARSTANSPPAHSPLSHHCPKPALKQLTTLARRSSLSAHASPLSFTSEHAPRPAYPVRLALARTPARPTPVFRCDTVVQTSASLPPSSSRSRRSHPRPRAPKHPRRLLPTVWPAHVPPRVPHTRTDGCAAAVVHRRHVSAECNRRRVIIWRHERNAVVYW